MNITIYELIFLVAIKQQPKTFLGPLGNEFKFNSYLNDYIDKNGELFFLNLMRFRDKCLTDSVTIPFLSERQKNSIESALVSQLVRIYMEINSNKKMQKLFI